MKGKTGTQSSKAAKKKKQFFWIGILFDQSTSISACADQGSAVYDSPWTRPFGCGRVFLKVTGVVMHPEHA
jgi:hypothetical protein